jgi:O-antigen/teichoic acid export membrane protein
MFLVSTIAFQHGGQFPPMRRVGRELGCSRVQTFSETTSPLAGNEVLPAIPPPAEVGRATSWFRSLQLAIPARSRLMPVGYSFADQALAVGGGFLVNVALARTQTKEEYGLFALSYSVFTFLLGLYYAAILEPYTVYASGRYRERFSEYFRLMARATAVLCLLLTGILLLLCLALSKIAPQLYSRALLGLSFTAGVLLSSYFLRRVFYVQRQPELAAKSSLVFFLTVVCVLWFIARAHSIDSFTVFIALALGWVVAGALLGRRLWFGSPSQSFLALEPHYWREHWNYSKWVLATAFVFQFTHQGYYWLVGGFLSAAEVANLRAMYLLVGPVEQAFIALSYLIVPALSAHYARKRMGDFLSLWKRYSLIVLATSSLYALAVRVVGRSAVHLLYGGKYDGLAPYLFVLTLVPLAIWIGGTMGHALNAVEKPQFVFWAYVSSGAVTFLAGIPLVIHFGLWGAVYGMILSASAYTMALAISFLFRFRNEWREFKPITSPKA